MKIIFNLFSVSNHSKRKIFYLLLHFSSAGRLITTASIAFDSSAEIVETALNALAYNFAGLECSVEKNVLDQGTNWSIR